MASLLPLPGFWLVSITESKWVSPPPPHKYSGEIMAYSSYQSAAFVYSNAKQIWIKNEYCYKIVSRKLCIPRNWHNLFYFFGKRKKLEISHWLLKIVLYSNWLWGVMLVQSLFIRRNFKYTQFYFIGSANLSIFFL